MGLAAGGSHSYRGVSVRRSGLGGSVRELGGNLDQGLGVREQ